jgi:hypothetical protein
MAELRVSAQGGDEGLLEAVLGIVRADGGAQECQHRHSVPVEKALKRNGVWGNRGSPRSLSGLSEKRPRERIRELVRRVADTGGVRRDG